MSVPNRRRSIFVGISSSSAILAALFVVGCTATAPTAIAATGTETNTIERFRLLSIPAADDAGDDVQVTRLLDEGHATILCIRLRHRAELPLHNVAVPVIIQAASGSGTVVMGDDRVSIGNGRFVTLAPKTKHSVIPDSDADLVLLVTQVRGGGAK